MDRSVLYGGLIGLALVMGASAAWAQTAPGPLRAAPAAASAQGWSASYGAALEEVSLPGSFFQGSGGVGPQGLVLSTGSYWGYVAWRPGGPTQPLRPGEAVPGGSGLGPAIPLRPVVRPSRP